MKIRGYAINYVGKFGHVCTHIAYINAYKMPKKPCYPPWLNKNNNLSPQKQPQNQFLNNF